MRAALIVGLSGAQLSADERAFLTGVRPAGLILFARNCVDPDQIRGLLGDASSAIGADDTLVLIDQEGGRVRRLRPPQWRELPAAAAFAALRDEDRARGIRATTLAARLTAHELRGLGINTNCTPVLDLVVPGAHQIIGDRGFGATPTDVAELGRAVAAGHMAGGVVPVIKHIPGHGRALADSHFELPVVDADRATLETMDFAPFRMLSDMSAAMTAHVVYSAIDPVHPASTSAIIHEVIRGHIGFDGLLMSDDLGMKALTGTFRARAEAVIAAGSDIVLHCSGNLEEMVAAAAGTPTLTGTALRRFGACIDITRRQELFDAAEAETALAEMCRHIA